MIDGLLYKISLLAEYKRNTLVIIESSPWIFKPASSRNNGMGKSTDISETASASLVFCMKRDRCLPLPARSTNSSPCVCITGIIYCQVQHHCTRSTSTSMQTALIRVVFAHLYKVIVVKAGILTGTACALCYLNYWSITNRLLTTMNR